MPPDAALKAKKTKLRLLKVNPREQLIAIGSFSAPQ